MQRYEIGRGQLTLLSPNVAYCRNKLEKIMDRTDIPR